MKKICVLLLVLMALSFCGCQINPRKEPIYIFYTSDVHCGLNENVTFASLKALVEETRKEHHDVLLVDSGDFLQGGNLGSLTRGEAIVDMMNEMGYDYVTFGNHEFDYGMDRLKELIDKADFEFIASNYIYSGNGTCVFEDVPEYIIKDFGHSRVGFIGVMTPDSLTTSNPSSFYEDGEYVYSFYNNSENDALIAKVQSVIDELRTQDVDYVIALTHLGSEDSCRPNDSISLISKTTGIDAVIDGHSHSVITGDSYPNKEGKDVVLTSVGTKLEDVGQMIIDTDGTITTTLFTKLDMVDEDMKEKVDEVFRKEEEILNEVVGQAPYTLSINGEDGLRRARNREVTVGNLVADSLRWFMDTDVTLMNGGGVRADISEGEITFGELLDINPFINFVVSVKLKGQQIIDALEVGASYVEAIPVFEDNPVGENGGFLHVSGLRYKIDTSVDSEVVYDKNGMMTSIGDNRRVHDVEVLKDGEYVPIDPEADYTLASVDYLVLNYGGGNSAFKGAVLQKNSYELISDVLKKYIIENGISDEYRELEGRIIVE